MPRTLKLIIDWQQTFLTDVVPIFNRTPTEFSVVFDEMETTAGKFCKTYVGVIWTANETVVACG